MVVITTIIIIARAIPVPSIQPILKSFNMPIIKLNTVAISKILNVSSSNCSEIKNQSVLGGIIIGSFNPK